MQKEKRSKKLDFYKELKQIKSAIDFAKTPKQREYDQHL